MKQFMILLLLLFSTVSLAQSTDGVAAYEIAQKTMMNTGNQFIYAVFGKEMLLSYLYDPDEIEAIQVMTKSELDVMALPFNANLSVFTQAVMALCYVLVVAYFLFKAGVVVLIEMWAFQSTGKFQSPNTSIRGILLKVLFIGVVVLAPISLLSNSVPYASGFTYLVFDLLGRSHHVADDAVHDMVLAHRKTLQTIRLPSAASKYNDGVQLNRFMACVASTRDRMSDNEYTENLTLYKVTNSAAEGQLTIGDCVLEVTVGVDNESPEMVRRLNVMDPLLELDPGIFDAAQKQGIINALSATLNVSSQGASVLSEPPKSGVLEDTDGLFDQYTSRDLTASDLKMWVERCPRVIGERLNQVGLYEQDRRIYNQLLARCVSATLTEKLVYPDTIHAMDNILSNDLFNQKVFPLCYSKAQVAQMTQGTGGAFSPRYILDNDDSPDDSMETISLRSCVAQACTANAMENGRMYECTQAIDLYEARKRDHILAERGIFSMGFHMMTLFLETGPSPAAKRVYNNTRFNFVSTKPNPITGAEVYATVPFIVPAKTGEARHIDEIDTSLSESYNDVILPAVDAPLPPSDLMSFMGARRLLACAQNPLQLDGRYACGSIPQEFSRFGMAMIHNVVALKTVMVAGDALRNVGTAINKQRQGSERGSMANEPKSEGSSAFLKMGTALIGVFGASFDMSAVMDVLALQGTVTDEFGEVSTESMDGLLSDGSLMALFLASSVSGDIMGIKQGALDLLDTGLFLGLLFGIFAGFLVALYPAFLLVKAVVKFMHLLFKTIFIDAFRLIDAIFDEDVDLLNDAFNRVLNDFIGLVIKFPLTISGVWLAWLLSNIVVAHVLNNITLTFVTNDGEQGYLDVAITMVFALSIVVLIYNMIMSIIESFYQVAVEWLQGMMSNDPFTSSRLDLQETRSFLRMIGR